MSGFAVISGYYLHKRMQGEPILGTGRQFTNNNNNKGKDKLMLWIIVCAIVAIGCVFTFIINCTEPAVKEQKCLVHHFIYRDERFTHGSSTYYHPALTMVCDSFENKN